MHTQLPIGVFDSGVGGLTVLSELRKAFPKENFIYLGDTANNPYGNRESEEIIRLSLKMVRFLMQQPMKMLVIACNTISVTPGLLEVLEKEVTVPIIPMRSGADLAVSLSPDKRIGVMATVATIASHSHKNYLKELFKDITVVEQPCPELAGLIEQGHLEDEILRKVAFQYVEPLMAAKVDTVILGCTHFPLVKSLLEELTEGKILFVDPAHEMKDKIQEVFDTYQVANQVSDKGDTCLYFTSEVDRGKEMASSLGSLGNFSIEEVCLA